MTVKWITWCQASELIQNLMTAPVLMRGALKWTFFCCSRLIEMPSCTSLLFQLQLSRFSYFKRTLCAQYYGYSSCPTDKLVAGSSSEGRCPVENPENSEHLSQQPFGGLCRHRILQTEWQTCEGGQMGKTTDYLFQYFVPPHFPCSPSRDPEINRSASRWRMSQFQECIWKTQEGERLVGVAVSDACVCTARHKSKHESSNLFSVTRKEQIQSHYSF